MGINISRHFLRPLAVAALLCAAPSCSNSDEHFITDRSYRREVHETFLSRGVELPPCDNLREREAMEFLYAYMPLADVTDHSPEYFLGNVRATFRAREEMPWGKDVPELFFRHFVLPLRANNEQLDSCRTVFYEELKPRVEGLGMKEAILEVNHWCHEKVSYQPSDARTLSPLATVKNAWGRCGEESTFTVAALRSVGIPARQVYTPRWAHTDDNHAWVEAWADGKWYFLGACEPEPVLDLGWFNAPASRSMLMHTKAFGKYKGAEEVVLESPNFTEINLIDNYATSAESAFLVIGEDGNPVDSALVDFRIYNYSEFYPAVSKYTGADGRTFLSAGLGDMLVWASKGDEYGFGKVSFGKDTLVEIRLSGEHSRQRSSVLIVPPAENVSLPEVSAAARAENDRRFAREDSIRGAYINTFPAAGPSREKVRSLGYPDDVASYLVTARRNSDVIENFLAFAASDDTPGKGRVLASRILSTLSYKDLRDVRPEILSDSYACASVDDPDEVISPRTRNEFLSPYKGYFRSVLPEQLRAAFTPAPGGPSTAEAVSNILSWISDNISVDTDPRSWRISQSPIGVYESRKAHPDSRGQMFVALCRSFGIPARVDPVTRKVQYRDGSDPESGWTDVFFDGAGSFENTPQGTLRLSYTPTKVIDNPKYYSHFTISKISGGRPQLLTFDEGQVDMGGGMDWKHAFSKGIRLDEGEYLLVCGNRLSDGSVPVSLQFFDIVKDGTTDLEIVIDTPQGSVPVIGSFDSETRVLSGEPSSPVSLLSLTGRGYFVTGLLEPGTEPTNHALRDLSAAREKLEAWGRPVILLCKDSKSLESLLKSVDSGTYGPLPGTVVFGVDNGDAVREGIVRNMGLPANAGLPLFILSDTFNRVFFVSSGYTIGLGDRITDTVARL